MVVRLDLRAVTVVAAMLFAGLPAASWSQAYPARPVRIIAPFGAGGGGDTTIRLLAQQLGAAMNQQFVVDNRPGGNGVIGVQEALRGGGDGYTLFYGSTTTLAANSSLLKKSGYDPVKDFAPISRVGVLPFMLVANTSQPFTNMKELLAYAKVNPGKLSYASANATGQVSSALFAQMAGLDILPVSYKASTNALTDTIAGTVSLMFVDIPPSLGHVKAGKLRAFGVTTAKRTSLLPDLPSIAEAGLPGYEVYAWTALCAPVGTPPEIVRRLNAELVKILAKPDIKEAFARVGVEVESSTPEQLAQFITAERDRWARLIRMARIEAE